MSGFAALMLHTNPNQNLSGLQTYFPHSPVDLAGVWVILAGLSCAQLGSAPGCRLVTRLLQAPYPEPNSYGTCSSHSE